MDHKGTFGLERRYIWTRTPKDFPPISHKMDFDLHILHSIHRRHKMLFFSCYFVFVGGSQFALVLLNLQQPKFLVQPSDLILKATVFGKYTLRLEMGPQGGALVS